MENMKLNPLAAPGLDGVQVQTLDGRRERDQGGDG